jgi:hypothetical protein
VHLGLGILKVAAVAIATMKVKEKFQIVMKLHRNDPCDVQMCKKCLLHYEFQNIEYQVAMVSDH